VRTTWRSGEIALDKASTADEAAKALNEAFTRLFVERKAK
jgi:hypothetical protein